MRILVAHCLPAERTGGATRLMGFTHDQLESDSHDVTYLTAADIPRWVPPRLNRWVFPLLVYREARGAARAGHPYRIVNVHEPHAALIARIRVGTGHAAVVVTSHGLEARGWAVTRRHPAPGRGGPSLRTRVTYPLLDLPLSRVGLRHADHVLCLNNQDRQFLQQRMSIDASRVTVVTPGADPCFAAASCDRTYKPVRRLLFAGTWIARKGTLDLVDALGKLHAAGRDFELIVLGGGVAEHVLRQSFPPSLRSRVTCVSAGDDRATASLFAGADAYVLPSLFEGTPLTLIEAMWSGLPVVTTATAGMKDVIDEGVTGLLVEPGSPDQIAAAIARLQDEPDLARRLGTAARKHAQACLTWRSASESVAAAYARAAGNPPAEVSRSQAGGHLQAAYDRWHARLATTPGLDTPWHSLLWRHLVPGRDLAGKVTLEIACGRGDLAAWCAAACRPAPRLIAADFSSAAAQIAASRLRAGGLPGQAVQMDAQQLPLRDASVDTVISCETLEHLPDPRKALAEFARVLAPGGRLFLTTPNYLCATGAYRIYLRLTGRRYAEEGQPVNRFLTAGRTRRWVHASGLTVERTDGEGHYLPWPGRNPVRLRIPANRLKPFALHCLIVAGKPGEGAP